MNTKTVILLSIFVIVIAGLFLAKPLSSGTGFSKISSEKKEGKKKNKKGSDAENEGSANVTIVNKWVMPSELNEISGIAWIDESHFACVQDEEGTIFIYNSGSGSVEKKVEFGGPGDYEGIALINNVAYVMRADGVFFKVDNINSVKPAVKEFKTHLTVQNDVEGFTYDKKMKRLLAAMKGEESGNKDFKGVYPIDPATNVMNTTPAFKLAIVAAEVETGKKKKNKGIQPSAVAVHPLTSDLYVVDASTPGLRIFSPSGEEKSTFSFNKSDFPQPEGITFSPDGKLYISNEGKKGVGNILEVSLGQ